MAWLEGGGGDGGEGEGGGGDLGGSAGRAGGDGGERGPFCLGLGGGLDVRMGGLGGGGTCVQSHRMDGVKVATTRPLPG